MFRHDSLSPKFIVPAFKNQAIFFNHLPLFCGLLTLKSPEDLVHPAGGMMLALIRVILMDLGNNAFLRHRLGSVQGGVCSPEQRDRRSALSRLPSGVRAPPRIPNTISVHT